MKDLYLQISKEIKKGKEMRELAFDMGGEEGFELRKQQDDLYKKTQFKKNFLKARSKLDGFDE
jgi:hypothetical protein